MAVSNEPKGSPAQQQPTLADRDFIELATGLSRQADARQAYNGRALIPIPYKAPGFSIRELLAASISTHALTSCADSDAGSLARRGLRTSRTTSSTEIPATHGTLLTRFTTPEIVPKSSSRSRTRRMTTPTTSHTVDGTRVGIPFGSSQ